MFSALLELLNSSVIDHSNYSKRVYGVYPFFAAVNINGEKGLKLQR